MDFCNNHVDVTVHALYNHAIKFVTFLVFVPEIPSSAKDASKLPFIIFLYKLCMVCDLNLIARILFFCFCRNTAMAATRSFFFIFSFLRLYFPYSFTSRNNHYIFSVTFIPSLSSDYISILLVQRINWHLIICLSHFKIVLWEEVKSSKLYHRPKSFALISNFFSFIKYLFINNCWIRYHFPR